MAKIKSNKVNLFFIGLNFIAITYVAATAFANPFIQSQSLRDFHEVALDLDQDGQFDYYEQSWGPIRIRKIYSTAKKGIFFKPGLFVTVELGKGLVYDLRYSCDRGSCRLQGSSINKSRVFYNSDSPDITIAVDMSQSNVLNCHLGPSGRQLGELLDTMKGTQVNLAIKQSIDTSCLGDKKGGGLENGESDVSKGFEAFFNVMLNIEEKSGEEWACLQSKPDLGNVGVLVANRISQILAGKDPLRIGCIEAGSEGFSARTTLDPRRIVLPTFGENECEPFKYQGVIGHELAHLTTFENEEMATAFESCLGVPSLKDQVKECSKNGKLSGRNSAIQVELAAQRTGEQASNPVNITSVMQLTEDPAGMIRRVPGSSGGDGKVPSIALPVTEQALAGINAARDANPQAFYGVPAKYFSLPEGMAATPRLADAAEFKTPRREPSSMASPSATPRRSGTSSSFESTIPASAVSNSRTSDTGSVGNVETRTVRLNKDPGVFRAPNSDKINIASGRQLVPEGEGARSANKTIQKNTASRVPARSQAPEWRDVASSPGALVATPTTGRQPSSSVPSGLATVGGGSFASADKPNYQGRPTGNPNPKPNPNSNSNPTQTPGANQKVSASATANQVRKLLPAGLVQAIKTDLSLTDFKKLQKQFGPDLRSKGVVIETIHGTIGAPIDKASQKFSIKDGKLRLIGANSPSGI